MSGVRMKSIWLPPSPLCLLLSTFYLLPSAFCFLLSAFWLLPTAIEGSSGLRLPLHSRSLVNLAFLLLTRGLKYCSLVY